MTSDQQGNDSNPQAGCDAPDERTSLRSMLAQVLILLAVGALGGLGHALARGTPQLDSAGLCYAGASGGLNQAAPWVSVQDAYALLRQGQAGFIDARDKKFFEVGHISGAATTQQGLIDPLMLGRFATATVIIIYDDTTDDCAASKRVAQAVGKLGYSDVRILQGGFEAWMESGYPAESGK